MRRQVSNTQLPQFWGVGVNEAPPNVQAPQFWGTGNNQANAQSQNIGILTRMRNIFQRMVRMLRNQSFNEINAQPQRNYGNEVKSFRKYRTNQKKRNQNV